MNLKKMKPMIEGLKSVVNFMTILVAWGIVLFTAMGIYSSIAVLKLISENTPIIKRLAEENKYGEKSQSTNICRKS